MKYRHLIPAVAVALALAGFGCGRESAPATPPSEGQGVPMAPATPEDTAVDAEVAAIIQEAEEMIAAVEVDESAEVTADEAEVENYLNSSYDLE